MANFLDLKQKIFLGLIVALLVLNIFTWQYVFVLAKPHYLRVDVLDVGQGDSIFIETPSMRRILIDGGPDSTVLGKITKHLPFWERNLDVVILTHPDADHVIGLLRVLQKYKVDYIVWTGIVRNGSNYQEWINLLQKKQKEGTKIIIAQLNTKITSGNVVIDTFNPFESLEGDFFSKKTNDTGIISHLVYGKNSFLFTADISSDVEQAMIKNNIYLDSDVLKVPHHGSRFSTSDEFLQAVSPLYAVISVGAHNTYGHPTPEVLQRLNKFDIKYYRSDINGDITFVSDGADYVISTEK